MHRDGVTLVSSLLIGRRNATGGESSVCDDDGRTLHGVSPIRPLDHSGPAQRDVLVVTLASGGPERCPVTPVALRR